MSHLNGFFVTDNEPVLLPRQIRNDMINPGTIHIHPIQLGDVHSPAGVGDALPWGSESEKEVARDVFIVGVVLLQQ